MIPKIIHYCWFGSNTITELHEKCINSWNIYLPEYQIIKWDESKFDILNKNKFVQEAFKKKKWAFVSDYVRAFALYNHGGIYLDIDVEIKNSLDIFLQHGAFSGFEFRGNPFTAVWGAEKLHNWPKIVIDFYDRLNEFKTITNTTIVSEILIKNYGVNRWNDNFQLLNDNIAIYPSDTFCIDIPKTFACHHFDGSWSEKEPVSFKDYLTLDYYNEKYSNMIIDRKDMNIEKELIKKISLKYILRELFMRLKRSLYL